MPWFYYGVHTENGRPYYGSPKTHKWRWEFYEHEVTILQWFETREEADSIEKRIIAFFLDNPNCLNECAGGKFSLESLRRGAKTRNQLPVKQETKDKLRKSNKDRWSVFTPEERSEIVRSFGFWAGTPEHLRAEIGLRIQKAMGTPVSILDTNTGEIKTFPSLRIARAYYKIGMGPMRKLYSGEFSEFKGLRVVNAGIV